MYLKHALRHNTLASTKKSHNFLIVCVLNCNVLWLCRNAVNCFSDVFPGQVSKHPSWAIALGPTLGSAHRPVHRVLSRVLHSKDSRCSNKEAETVVMIEMSKERWRLFVEISCQVYLAFRIESGNHSRHWFWIRFPPRFWGFQITTHDFMRGFLLGLLSNVAFTIWSDICKAFLRIHFDDFEHPNHRCHDCLILKPHIDERFGRPIPLFCLCLVVCESRSAPSSVNHWWNSWHHCFVRPSELHLL